eukprot:1158122-Pelagomonas_calceolata.AAC.7
MSCTTPETCSVCTRKCHQQVKYAFVSLRGLYPSAPDKPNQDSLCVHTHYGGDPESAFFGIFDGHGEFGTECSQFAKDKVCWEQVHRNFCPWQNGSGTPAHHACTTAYLFAMSSALENACCCRTIARQWREMREELPRGGKQMHASNNSKEHLA